MNDFSRDQAVWNTIFTGLFFLLLSYFFFSLTDGLDTFEWLFLLDRFDIVILSLATFRIVRLVVYDKIFQFVRNWFFDDVAAGQGTKPPRGVRRTIAELIECQWCVGLWGALFVTFLYLSFDVGRFFVLILAIAAVGSFLQNISKMIARIGN